MAISLYHRYYLIFLNISEKYYNRKEIYCQQTEKSSGKSLVILTEFLYDRLHKIEKR